MLLGYRTRNGGKKQSSIHVPLATWSTLILAKLSSGEPSMVSRRTGRTAGPYTTLLRVSISQCMSMDYNPAVYKYVLTFFCSLLLHSGFPSKLPDPEPPLPHCLEFILQRGLRSTHLHSPFPWLGRDLFSHFLWISGCGGSIKFPSLKAAGILLSPFKSIFRLHTLILLLLEV